MCAVVFNVMKLRFELRSRNTQRRGEIIFQVSDFSGIVQAVFDLREKSMAFTAIRTVAVFFTCVTRFKNINRSLPTASCQLPTAFSCPRRCEQNLLMQVCSRIA